MKILFLENLKVFPKIEENEVVIIIGKENGQVPVGLLSFKSNLNFYPVKENEDFTLKAMFYLGKIINAKTDTEVSIFLEDMKLADKLKNLSLDNKNNEVVTLYINTEKRTRKTTSAETSKTPRKRNLEPEAAKAVSKRKLEPEITPVTTSVTETKKKTPKEKSSSVKAIENTDLIPEAFFKELTKIKALENNLEKNAKAIYESVKNASDKQLGFPFQLQMHFGPDKDLYLKALSSKYDKLKSLI